MNIAIIGGAGFIGTNLALKLSGFTDNKIKIIDRDESYFDTLKTLNLHNVDFVVASFDNGSDFDEQVCNQDIVYHLASTNIPGTSNKSIPDEIDSNVTVTARLLDSCVRQNVEKVVFVSSGGAVYGKKGKCPLNEDAVTYPITSYGIQKLAIEKLLYLYRFQEGIDYRVIRLANPYGPYQRPNGKLGVITTFIYEALTKGVLKVYGDGSIVRDFIYIDDAMRGILNIVNGESDFRVFNLGSGKGISINSVIKEIQQSVRKDLRIDYIASRPTDVSVNYLDISRYESQYGSLNPMSLRDGIIRTASFLKSQDYSII